LIAKPLLEAPNDLILAGLGTSTLGCALTENKRMESVFFPAFLFNPHEHFVIDLILYSFWPFFVQILVDF
jgi:hypothetical protein